MWRRHPENDTPEAWHDLIAAMGEAVAIAAEHDVTLAFEPEVANVVDSAAKGRRLLDELGSPHLKVVIDGANVFHAGELPRMRAILEETFALLGSDIVLAHAKDLSRDGEAGHEAAGTGLLDYGLYMIIAAQRRVQRAVDPALAGRGAGRRMHELSARKRRSERLTLQDESSVLDPYRTIVVAVRAASLYWCDETVRLQPRGRCCRRRSGRAPDGRSRAAHALCWARTRPAKASVTAVRAPPREPGRSRWRRQDPPGDRGAAASVGPTGAQRALR